MLGWRQLYDASRSSRSSGSKSGGKKRRTRVDNIKARHSCCVRVKLDKHFFSLFAPVVKFPPSAVVVSHPGPFRENYMLAKSLVWQ